MVGVYLLVKSTRDRLFVAELHFVFPSFPSRGRTWAWGKRPSTMESQILNNYILNQTPQSQKTKKSNGRKTESCALD